MKQAIVIQGPTDFYKDSLTVIRNTKPTDFYEDFYED